MSGVVAANFHEGSRSEILADYLFSNWGTVTPVRRQDDYGADLYCTLTERIGQRARVRDYFVAQVKSTDDPWIFDDLESVRWLVEYPTPFFLCTVNKKEGLVRIYHIFPRFEVWAKGEYPSTLELRPGTGSNGKNDGWVDGLSFSLSAPIVQAGVPDLMDADRMGELRGVFAYWVDLDRENCDRVRQGLRRFRLPPSWTTNELPNSGIVESGYALPTQGFLDRGLLHLAEAIECIGGQLGHLAQVAQLSDPTQRYIGNYAFALEAALLLDRLHKEHSDVFENNPSWRYRVPGRLGQVVNLRLNEAVGGTGYHYAGLDALENSLADNPIIEAYLEGGKVDSA